MSDTIEITQTPLQIRLIELYMESCRLVSTLKNQISQKQKSEVKNTFQKFKIDLTEMYYLARTIEDIKDDSIMKKLKEWTNIKCGISRSNKYYLYSIKLFEDFSELMISRGRLI